MAPSAGQATGGLPNEMPGSPGQTKKQPGEPVSPAHSPHKGKKGLPGLNPLSNLPDAPRAGADRAEDAGGNYFGGPAPIDDQPFGFANGDGEMQVVPWSSQSQHKKLVLDASTPLELAVLAKLCVWETGDADYKLDEMMKVARFVESKLIPPAPKPTRWKPRFRCVVLVCLVFMMFLLCLFTVLGARVSRVASVDTAGVLAKGSNGAVAAGVAVHLHSLLSYPKLPDEDLRLVEDVVLKHLGTFHYYRVASVSRLAGGSIRLAAEDGSSIRIDGNTVLLKRPYEREVLVDMTEHENETGSDLWAHAGVFRALAAFPDRVGSGDLGAIPQLQVVDNTKNNTVAAANAST